MGLLIFTNFFETFFPNLRLNTSWDKKSEAARKALDFSIFSGFFLRVMIKYQIQPKKLKKGLERRFLVGGE
jgi:hypothetical protein